MFSRRAFMRLGGGRRRRVRWLLSFAFFTLFVLLYVFFHWYILQNLDSAAISNLRSVGFQASNLAREFEFLNASEIRILPPDSSSTLHRIPDSDETPADAPGENGKGVFTDEKDKLEETMKKWFMNVEASDKISLDRLVPDQRSEACRRLSYDEAQLPRASVVIIFTDEAWSPLLRTVHSVVNRTPKKLLAEIVLVDDNSQRNELKEKLVEHLKRFNGLVRLVRAKTRLGLIRAKIVGAKFAFAEVVVFLDSHCEATKGWIEPLLSRIKEKRSAVVCPVIDAISDRNMEYMGGSLGGIGTFWWSLHYKMDPIPERERRRRINPETDYVNSPTMAGGLFAANRDYFFEVGAYDAEMDIWGGENLEISFRVWMCGGSIEIIPCSHVGHIYRSGHPYNMTGRGGNLDVHGTNSKRLAEVWMDDYKRLFYVQRMGLKESNDFIGDLSERKRLRDLLNCHSFKWFLDNVIPEKFVPDENVKAYGLVKSGNLCLDTLQRNDNKGTIFLGVFHCQMAGSSSQMLSWSQVGELRRETTCVDVSDVRVGMRDGRPTRKVVMRDCSDQDLSLFHHIKDGALKHLKSGLCLDVGGLSSGDDVIFAHCDENAPTQKWAFHGTYF